MKKILFILFAWFFLIGTANAATWYTVRKDQGGYISMVTGYKSTSGQTLFEIDSSGGLSVYVTSTSTISGSGVSQLQSSTSGYIVVYNSSVGAYGVDIISGNSIVGGTLQSGISGVGLDVFGDTPVYNLTSGTTLSGSTLYASYIGNYGATSEVTYYLVSAVAKMSFNISLDQDRSSGSSIWVLTYPGDKIINQPNFVSGNTNSGTGVSYYFLSGVTGDDNVTFIAIGAGVWKTFEQGSPEHKTYD